MTRMHGRLDDPRELPDFRNIDTAALERAVSALKYLDQFHTLDVATHTIVLEVHRERAREAGFASLVGRWLDANATRLGLRGPLPGHPSRGDRWAWYNFGAGEKS